MISSSIKLMTSFSEWFAGVGEFRRHLRSSSDSGSASGSCTLLSSSSSNSVKTLGGSWLLEISKWGVCSIVILPIGSLDAPFLADRRRAQTYEGALELNLRTENESTANTYLNTISRVQSCPNGGILYIPCERAHQEHLDDIQLPPTKEKVPLGPKVSTLPDYGIRQWHIFCNGHRNRSGSWIWSPFERSTIALFVSLVE